MKMDLNVQKRGKSKKKKESKYKRAKLDLEKNCLEASCKFEWQDTWPTTNAANENTEDNESADSDDDLQKEEKKNKKRSKKPNKEELLLLEREQALADNNRQPDTVEDFDRLVLASPNSSLIWLKYVAFHLQNAEIDRARAVIKRALQAISFREEQEKLSVWTASLNLENIYGSEASLNEIFQNAIQNNDPLKMYNRLVDVLVESEKLDQATQLFEKMVKKFKSDHNVWLRYLSFLMEKQLTDQAHKIFQRSQLSLSRAHQVRVACKMARLEFQHGESECGCTMMENILANNPRRTDLWSEYVDLMTKMGNTNAARTLLKRAVTIKGSKKQMKFLFKKYLDFENKYGDDKTVQAVKDKALEYVNSCDQSYDEQ